MSKFASALPAAFSQTWNWLWIRYYFKFVLPKIEIAEIDGIRLDLKPFSPRIRNRILRGYEEPEKRMCREFVSADDSVLEIGGGIGFIGLFCQTRIGVRTYITVEANPHTIELLKRNYQLNGLAPTVWNFAIAKEEGVTALDVRGDFWEHSVGTEKTGVDGGVSVPCLTFPQLLQRAGSGINVLIIDIEGAERFIDFSALPAQIDKLLIEVHPHVIGQRKVDAIISSLNSQGFYVTCEEANTFALLRNQ